MVQTNGVARRCVCRDVIVMAYGRAPPGEIMCWRSTPEVLAVVGLYEAGFERAGSEAVARFEVHRSALG